MTPSFSQSSVASYSSRWLGRLEFYRRLSQHCPSDSRKTRLLPITNSFLTSNFPQSPLRNQRTMAPARRGRKVVLIGENNGGAVVSKPYHCDMTPTEQFSLKAHLFSIHEFPLYTHEHSPRLLCRQPNRQQMTCWSLDCGFGS